MLCWCGGLGGHSSIGVALKSLQSHPAGRAIPTRLLDGVTNASLVCAQDPGSSEGKGNLLCGVGVQVQVEGRREFTKVPVEARGLCVAEGEAEGRRAGVWGGIVVWVSFLFALVRDRQELDYLGYVHFCSQALIIVV